MNQIKNDHRKSGCPTLRCSLCTIGIGNTKYNGHWYKHKYREPYFYMYKGEEYILDIDCYLLVKDNSYKLENAYC